MRSMTPALQLGSAPARCRKNGQRGSAVRFLIHLKECLGSPALPYSWKKDA